MAQRLILSIVLQDIIKNKEGMPAAGYWMYFYDKKSPTTLRNVYYKNQVRETGHAHVLLRTTNSITGIQPCRNLIKNVVFYFYT